MQECLVGVKKTEVKLNKASQCGEERKNLVISKTLSLKSSEQGSCQFMKFQTLLNCQYSCSKRLLSHQGSEDK